VWPRSRLRPPTRPRPRRSISARLISLGHDMMMASCSEAAPAIEPLFKLEQIL
jgi:hypothetical protein